MPTFIWIIVGEVSLLVVLVLGTAIHVHRELEEQGITTKSVSEEFKKRFPKAFLNFPPKKARRVQKTTDFAISIIILIVSIWGAISMLWNFILSTLDRLLIREKDKSN